MGIANEGELMDWKELQNEPTEDLIEFVKFKTDPNYLDDARAAFVVLTHRFEQDVLGKCTIICRNWGYSDADALELANRTFEKFWEYHSFDKEKRNVADIDLAFKLYLYKIAENELKQAYNDQSDPYDGSEKIITSLDDLNIDGDIEKARELRKAKEVIDRALSKLTPKHKIIFLTYKAYEEDGHKLPRELLKELRESLNLTQNSIRVYKKQAIEAVEKRLNK